MTDIVIKVENLSKQYRLGSVGTGSFADDVNRAWHLLRGKEDPYLKIGEENDRTQKGSSEYVWALKNINFEVKHGEVLGIIGGNGAGKSTLLKILSRTTSPTTGSVKIKGRVASLLEVGTGFHPELSGRENIFLNGAILGMHKKEIKNKFDEIIDFAGVERYIDTPVKRYSSGMYVRLAFGVAAHLESEILIVDEVLAVGDAEFQKKCLGKMKDVSNRDGRTVLFVSHNLGAIKNLCAKAILMDKGKITMLATTAKVTEFYFSTQNSERKYVFNFDRKQSDNQKLVIKKIVFNEGRPVFYGGTFKLSIYFEISKKIEGIHCGIGFNSTEGERIVTVDSDSEYSNNYNNDFETGLNVITLKVDNFRLSPGMYFFDAAIREGAGTLNILDYVLDQSGFEILPDQNTPNHFNEGKTGGYRPVPKII
ncbi:MAG: ATP-binding cassette protein [Ferruginibacter sp.]|nr:ATP-binding cassette protein [Ferruginibacter sp.]